MPVSPSFRSIFFLIIPPPPTSTLFPYTTLFRSLDLKRELEVHHGVAAVTLQQRSLPHLEEPLGVGILNLNAKRFRSEEHTSELQSRLHLVCRLLLEKKKKNNKQTSKHKKNRNLQ